jgi:hypothetical protein
MTIPTLPLLSLADRHYALPPEVAGCWLLAARVALDSHHAPPQDFVIEDDGQARTVSVNWEPADDRGKAAMNNRDDATCTGAYACAIAGLELSRGLLAVRRAETKTGADYYLAPAGTAVDDLESCVRLEVSGTNLDEADVRHRLTSKVKQARAGVSFLPAVAAVVGFKVRLIAIRSVEALP